MEMKDIPKLSDEELSKIIDVGNIEARGYQLAYQEYTRRKLDRISKRHWTLTPGFWVAILAMIFAFIAALPVIRQFFQAFPF